MNYKQQRLKKLKAKYGEPETLDQMFEWLLQALQDKGDRKDQPFVIGLAMSVSYRDKVSNTHYAPANGETNWRCERDKQVGYPGYTGRVWIRLGYTPRNGPWASDLFAQCMTYPGTGGGGSYDGPWKELSSARYERFGHRKNDDFPDVQCWSWDFRFFHDDFPLIRDLWTKNNLFKVIETNKRTVDIDTYRVWEDPTTADNDKIFLEECKRIKEEERKSYT